MSHILHCCQRSPSPLLPFRSVPRSGRFASMSTRSWMIHPNQLWRCYSASVTVHSLAVLPARATTHAISSKRLTVPCDCSTFCVSRLIRDGLASQHALTMPCDSHNAQHSFLGQIFCCPRCVLTCMWRFRVCLASAQSDFLLHR